MNQAPGGDDSDNARPQRHLVIDKDDVGTTPFRQNTAIGETCGSGGRRRNQVPGLGKRQHTGRLAVEAYRQEAISGGRLLDVCEKLGIAEGEQLLELVRDGR